MEPDDVLTAYEPEVAHLAPLATMLSFPEIFANPWPSTLPGIPVRNSWGLDDG